MARANGDVPMTIHFSLQPLIALIAGVIILVAPRFLNYVVAIYLIIVGILGLFPNLLHHVG
jgi:threonine/homoserine efflux transporter RhtA